MSIFYEKSDIDTNCLFNRNSVWNAYSNLSGLIFPNQSVAYPDFSVACSKVSLAITCIYFLEVQRPFSIVLFQKGTPRFIQLRSDRKKKGEPIWK